MAVYTAVSAEALAGLLAGYDIGAAISFKGIAEGVENSNYLLETTAGRYVLTLYEKRVAVGDLPWFLALMTHLAARGLPVPRPVDDRRGVALQELCDRPACLIEFLPGVSIITATPAQAHAAGAALGELHRAAADFPLERPNALGPDSWAPLAERCGAGLAVIDAGLPALVAAELAGADWPDRLPRSTIHADLFPDNVLLLGDRVTGLIDFYFACTDFRAYDLAVMHGAWCFDADGQRFRPDAAAALVAGYTATHPLSDAERAALPILCRGASLRFLLTRAWDWLNTPADALVTRKDPLAFARRLAWYRSASPGELFGR